MGVVRSFFKPSIGKLSFTLIFLIISGTIFLTCANQGCSLTTQYVWFGLNPGVLIMTYTMKEMRGEMIKEVITPKGTYNLHESELYWIYDIISNEFFFIFVDVLLIYLYICFLALIFGLLRKLFFDLPKRHY